MRAFRFGSVNVTATRGVPTKSLGRLHWPGGNKFSLSRRATRFPALARQLEALMRRDDWKILLYMLLAFSLMVLLAVVVINAGGQR